MLQRAEQALEKTKVNIMLDRKVLFLSTVMAQLPIRFDDSIPTGATDGKNILLNTSYFLGLNQKEREFLLLHEIMHVVLMHISRKGNKDHLKYNIAGDYVINSYLVEQGYPLIKGGLYDPQYNDMSTEQIYDLLPDGLEIDIDLIDLIPNPDMDKEQQADEVQSIVIQATQLVEMTNNCGSIPSAIKRYLDDIRNPKVNWKVVLQRFLQDTTKADSTWTKPNKRHLNRGYYLPSLRSPNLAKITFAIDTSGSISDEMFNQFITEVASVLKQFKPNEIDVILFDTCVQSINTVRNVSELRSIEFKGYGGTCPNQMLETFDRSNSMALIVITDGYFSRNLIKVTKPVIWCIFDNSDFKAPYGMVINYKLRG